MKRYWSNLLSLVLFCSILLYSVLFDSVLFYSTVSSPDSRVVEEGGVHEEGRTRGGTLLEGRGHDGLMEG
jgi:hypothetical protein